MRSFKFGEILGVLWGRDLRWWGLEGGGGELKGSGGRGKETYGCENEKLWYVWCCDQAKKLKVLLISKIIGASIVL